MNYYLLFFNMRNVIILKLMYSYCTVLIFKIKIINKDIFFILEYIF